MEAHISKNKMTVFWENYQNHIIAVISGGSVSGILSSQMTEKFLIPITVGILTAFLSLVVKDLYLWIKRKISCKHKK